MTINLSEIAKKKKIKYFLISYVDFFGVLRSKLVPAHSIKEMQKEGAGFAGFSTYLDMSPSDPDMAAIPDPRSLIQLPWQQDVGWLAGDLWMDGKPVASSPRVMLRLAQLLTDIFVTLIEILLLGQSAVMLKELMKYYGKLQKQELKQQCQEPQRLMSLMQ